MKLICGKCGTEQDMTKRIHGKRPEDFSWWCPQCEDQISDSIMKEVEK